MHDLKYGFRNLWKAKGFAIVAVLTLAIGVGANTAIFSIVDTILLRPLPFRNPDQLVRLYETEAAPGTYPFSSPDLDDWRKQNHTFQDMTMYGWVQDMNASQEGRADHIGGVATEVNFFDVFGVPPLLGRTWAADENQEGKDRVTVLSYAMWQGRFAGDPGVIGKAIDLDTKKYTIVGVMPPGFRFPSRQAQLWFPSDMVHDKRFPRGSHWASAVGRMKPGVSVKEAQANLTVISAELEKAYPNTNYKVGAKIVSLRDNLVGDSRQSLWMMLSAVALVLLIACANVANLLLSRAVGRQKEMAVRSALGAGRGQLVRQLLTESLMLSLAGGAAGLALAWAIVRVFTQLKSFALPQFNVIEVNGTVMAFAFALAVVTGVLFGLVPALQTSRPALHDELKGGAGSSISMSRRRRLASDVLVVSEIALSLLLLVGAGLLLKDFVRLRNTDIGVRPDGVWTAAVQLPEARYEKAPQRQQFARAALERVQHLHGVDSAALSDRMPLEGGSNGYIKLRGQVSAPFSGPLVETHSVTPDYFRAIGARVIAGRVFTDADAEQVAANDARFAAAREAKKKVPPEETNVMIYPSVINESMAKFFWQNQNAIGQVYSRGSDTGPWQQVVGVVSDVRQWGLTHAPVPEGYNLLTAPSRFYFVAHTTLPPAGLTGQVRQQLAQMDNSLPLFNVRTMWEVIDDNAQGSQFLSLLVGAFSAFAVLLAAVGIYGVLSYVVNQRTREIGIRMSLGATRGRVQVQVLNEGMRLAAIGFAIGVVGAISLGRVMKSLLHGVKANDPWVIGGTTALLALIALAACYIPARRAAGLDPTVALRQE